MAKYECAYCQTPDAPENGIVVNKIEQGGDSMCNVCLTDSLRKNTTLSDREAEVAALKLQGHGHKTIAELLDAAAKPGEAGPKKSTVDEYSRRINEKAEMARSTFNHLQQFA